MSEDEKQAMEYLKQLLLQDRLTDYDKRQLVEIIDKQQKEVEKELREMRKEVEIKNAEIELINVIYISKDKIREKIKELEKEKEEKEEYGLDCTLIYEHEIDTNGIIRVLKELLGGCDD